MSSDASKIYRPTSDASGTVYAMPDLERFRAALEEIASGLSVRDPYSIANEALGRAVTS